jgi:uncharacterized protein YukJ
MVFMNANSVYSRNQALNCRISDVFFNVKPGDSLHEVMMLQRHIRVYCKGNGRIK